MADDEAVQERREKLCFTLFSNAFGAQFSRHKWKEMLACLISVDCGLKDAYLVDQCYVYVSQMRDLIQSLLTNKILTKLDLKVVVICDDLFVVSKENVLQHLREISSGKNDVLLIDVSESLAAPITLADCKSWKSIEDFCNDFEQFLNGDDVDECVFPFEKKYSSACTIFGIILGYPIVYWSSLNDSRNCLAHQRLQVITLAIRHWHQYYTVCSFSSPTSLIEISRRSLDLWKNKIATISGNFLTIDLQISEKQVTLPTVIL